VQVEALSGMRSQVRCRLQKEELWRFNMVGEDLAVNRGKSIRQSAQNVRKTAKCLSSPAEIVRYTAKTASQSAGTAAAKKGRCISLTRQAASIYSQV